MGIDSNNLTIEIKDGVATLTIDLNKVVGKTARGTPVVARNESWRVLGEVDNLDISISPFTVVRSRKPRNER